jgi:hypothetical protein
MNKKQFIFLAIIIIILNIVGFYMAFDVEDWWGPVPKNPIYDTVAGILLMVCITIDILVFVWVGEKIYDWLGK